MSAFERLQNYTSGLKQPKVGDKNKNERMTSELSFIEGTYSRSTPVGYFLQKLHQMGYSVVENICESSDGVIVPEIKYLALSDEVKQSYTCKYEYTEFAKMLLSDGDNLVISGAGSGKTTALVFKIMKDILTGEALKTITVGESSVQVVDDIFVGTFLKSGADELKNTLASWQRKLGYIVTTERMHFGTLHAEFKRALNSIGVQTPIGSAEVIGNCLRSAVSRLGITNADSGKLSRDDYAVIESIVSYYRNRLGTEKYQHPSCQDYGLLKDVLDSLVNMFAQERLKAGVMDFEDLQDLLYKYLYVTPNKAVQDFVASRYKYIYLDEFQDTSEVQYAIIKFYARGRLNCNKVQDSSLLKTDDLLGTPSLYTGVATKGKIIAIGDDDQCLVGDTMIKTPFGVRAIANIKRGETVFASLGNYIKPCVVESVSSKPFIGKLYTITTKSGKVIKGTGGHICFARTKNYDNAIFLTYDSTKGFNLSLVADGFYNWLLAKFNDSASVESWYDHLLNNYELDVTANVITRMQEAMRLVNDLSYNISYKTYIDTSGDTYSKITMFKDGEYSVCDGRYKNMGTSKTFTRTGTIDEVFSIIKDKKIPYVDSGYCTAIFDEKEYVFTPISNLVVGMCLPIELNDSIIEDEIISVEMSEYSGLVYDINVGESRNYIANGVLVHNCIYSWRGSDISVMCESFPKDFCPTTLSLSKNYRCPSNILNPVLTSIEQNSKRFEKHLQSSADGGVFNAFHFTNITSMLNNLREQIDEDMAKGYSVAIICRTNFDGVIPAFLLEMDHRYTFSVSSDAMTLSSPLPKNILNASRLFMDKYSVGVKGVLEMILPYRCRFDIKKLCDKMSADANVGKKTTLWNIPKADLDYSLPELSKLVARLKTCMFAPDGKKIIGGDISALRYLYLYLLTDVFDGNSSYCVRTRAYIESVLYLLKNKDFKNVYEFFDEVNDYSERLKARVKKTGTDISIVTVHEFKGKERDSVYIWHDSYNFFPASKTDLNNKFQVEEERRVHYIACTRAKKKCTVYSLRGAHGMFYDEMNCSIVDPTIIKGTLKKNSEVSISESCSQEEAKLNENLQGFDFKNDGEIKS